MVFFYIFISMNYTCPVCAIAPSSHSLKLLREKDGIRYYYTCPSLATLYYDAKGIVAHYEGVLSEIPPEKEWVWFFDSLGFGLIHASQTSVARGLANLITTKFSQNLKKIIILNPTIYVRLTHSMLMPFLNTKVQELIEVNLEMKCLEDIYNYIQ
jgi:hypothetical protein